MSEINLSPALPALNMPTLGLQLRLLWERAWDAAEAHDKFLAINKVPNTYSTGWYQCEFSRDDYPEFTIDTDGDFYWSGTDRDGDCLIMTVPESVLTGKESPEEWAARTYTRYLQRQAEEAANKQERWEANKNRRHEEYLRLKAEFEDGKTAGATAG